MAKLLAEVAHGVPAKLLDLQPVLHRRGCSHHVNGAMVLLAVVPGSNGRP